MIQDKIQSIFFIVVTLIFFTICPIIFFDLNFVSNIRNDVSIHLNVDLEYGTTTALVGTPPRLVNLEICGECCGVTLWTSPYDSYSLVFPESFERTYGIDVLVIGDKRIITPIRFVDDIEMQNHGAIQLNENYIETWGILGLCADKLKNDWGIVPKYFARCSDLCIGKDCKPRPSECGENLVLELQRKKVNPQWSVCSCFRTKDMNIVELVINPIPDSGRYSTGMFLFDDARKVKCRWCDAALFDQMADEWTATVAVPCDKPYKTKWSDSWTTSNMFPKYLLNNTTKMEFVTDPGTTMLATETQDGQQSIYSCIRCKSNRELVALFSAFSMVFIYIWNMISQSVTDDFHIRISVIKISIWIHVIACYLTAAIGESCGWMIAESVKIPQIIIEHIVIMLIFGPIIMGLSYYVLIFFKINRKHNKYDLFIHKTISDISVIMPIYTSFWYISYAEKVYLVRAFFSIASGIFVAIYSTSRAITHGILYATCIYNRRQLFMFLLTLLFASISSTSIYIFSVHPVFTTIIGETFVLRIFCCAFFVAIVNLSALFNVTKE